MKDENKANFAIDHGNLPQNTSQQQQQQHSQNYQMQNRIENFQQHSHPIPHILPHHGMSDSHDFIHQKNFSSFLNKKNRL